MAKLANLVPYDKDVVNVLERAKKTLEELKATEEDANKNTDAVSPTTGDDNILWLLFILLMIGSGVVFLSAVRKKKIY